MNTRIYALATGALSFAALAIVAGCATHETTYVPEPVPPPNVVVQPAPVVMQSPPPPPVTTTSTTTTSSSDSGYNSGLNSTEESSRSYRSESTMVTPVPPPATHTYRESVTVTPAEPTTTYEKRSTTTQYNY